MEVNPFVKDLSIFALASSIALFTSNRRSKSLTAVHRPSPSDGSAPVILLIGSTAPSTEETSQPSNSGGPPLAFECVGDRTIAEHA
jgi:hypothetical protein